MEFLGICIITRDVPLLVEFYTRILGTESEGDDNHAEFKTIGASLTIFSEKGMKEMAPSSMTGAGSGNIIIGIKVKNVDEEYERLKGLGVDFVKLPKSYEWGSRSFWIRDPDGNIVNFLSIIQ